MKKDNINELNVNPSKIEFIFNEIKSSDMSVSLISIIFIMILLFLSIQLKNHFYNIELDGLDYWMFEIFFVRYLTYKIFEINVYIHKKISVGFIIIFCLLIKIFSTIDIFKNDKVRKIYKNKNYNMIIIPLGIIGFILLTLLRAYSFTKTKWFFHTKYISPINFLLLYCIIGTLLCFISSLISNSIECISKEKYPDIDLICKVKNYNN